MKVNFIFLIGRCIVFHDALSLETATHHLVQRIEEVRDRPIESEFLFKETKRNCSKCFSSRRGLIGVYFSIILHEMLCKYFWRKLLKEASLKLLPKMLPGETLCKKVQIFPPKVLVYGRKFFPDTVYYNLIEN